MENLQEQFREGIYILFIWTKCDLDNETKTEL
jgi:hypothetical protein